MVGINKPTSDDNNNTLQGDTPVPVDTTTQQQTQDGTSPQPNQSTEPGNIPTVANTPADGLSGAEEQKPVPPPIKDQSTYLSQANTTDPNANTNPMGMADVIPSIRSSAATTPEAASAPHEETPAQIDANAESRTVGIDAVTGNASERPSEVTFTPLAQARLKNGRVVPIVMCSAMLQNQHQCWRSGDFLVEGPDIATPYQLCRYHATMEMDRIDMEKQQQQAEQPQPAASEPVTEQPPLNNQPADQNNAQELLSKQAEAKNPDEPTEPPPNEQK